MKFSNDKTLRLVRDNDILILLANDLEEEYLFAIISNLEFPGKVLLVTDKDVLSTEERASLFKCIIKRFPGRNHKLIAGFINELLRDLHRLIEIQGCQTKIRGIIGLDEEYGYKISKALADAFKTVYHSSKTINYVTDKHEQKKRMQKLGVEVPRHIVIDLHSVGFRDNGVKDLWSCFPCVLKPVAGCASTGVYKNKDMKDLIKNVLRAKRYADLASGKFLLEEYIDGNEYSCDFLVDKNDSGISVSVLRVAKKIVGEDSFANFDGFILFNPDSIMCPEFSLKQLSDICMRIARAYDMHQGIGMVDFKSLEGKIIVIESTIRPGIDTFIDLMARAYGYTSINILIRQYFGFPVKIHLPKTINASVCLLSSKIGKIKKYDTSRICESRFKQNVMCVNKYYDVGEVISKYDVPEEKSSSLGYVLLKNLNFQDLHSLVKEINDLVDIKFANRRY